MVGLLAGPAVLEGQTTLGSGIGAILFYLVAYALGTIAAFSALACLRRGDREVATYDDLSGLRHEHPFFTGVILISMLSLIGMPPLIGFIGKLYLIGSVFYAGYPVLVVVLVLNSAIAAAYYLKIGSITFFGPPNPGVTVVPSRPRRAAAILAAVLAVVLGGLPGNALVEAARQASRPAVVVDPVPTAAEFPPPDVLPIAGMTAE